MAIARWLGRREAFFLVGGFMAIWIIAYGGVQALAPRILGRKDQSVAASTAQAIRWAGLLVPIPFALALAALVADGPSPGLTAILVAGLGIGYMFGSQLGDGGVLGTLVAFCVPVAAAINWTLVQRSQRSGHRCRLLR